MDTSNSKKYNRLELATLVLFSAIAVARIIATYSVFSQTWDEPVHVASGVEWLQQGTYTYEDHHPPLARIAVAIGPYLKGIRLSSRDLKPQALVDGGNAIFAAHGDYVQNLTLARLGALPFFFLGIGIVWYQTRRLFGSWAAVSAAGLFTMLPPILGHAGVAATDLPLAATVALALFAFMNWLGRPTISHSLALGITAGLAILTKFSALVFLPASGAAVVLCWLFASEVTFARRCKDITLRLKPLGLAAVICVGLVLAFYRFSFHPTIGPDERPHQLLDHLFGQQGKWHDVAYRVAETAPVPVPEFFHGITQAKARVANFPTDMYLLGQVGTQGWWYFFPVALMVKTPIPFLILTVVGALEVIRRWKKSGHDWQLLVPLASALALLLVCLPAKLNIGLRLILPIYPLLSILAGVGITGLWNTGRARGLGRVLAVGLAGWMLVSSVLVHPDYLAYFNEFAGDHPEQILVDSDLDWGQDLLRLSAVLHARAVPQVSIAYNGSADLGRMNLPPFEVLAPCDHTTGWIAISLYKLQMSKPSVGCGGFSWLDDYAPVALVGKSIRLYWIPKAEEASSPQKAVKLNE